MHQYYKIRNNDMLKVKERFLIYFFGIIKIGVHFLTNTNYGLHRDEFLYFDQGKHLAFGYYEVPPLTPFIGRLADIFGGNLFAIRLFPAIAGAIIVILSCKLVKNLGGGVWAIILTGLALVLTPSLLESNTLFQPVSFNQLFWFLIGYSVIQIISKNKNHDYYILGILIGFSLLTKYSVTFYLIALLAGVLLTKERYLLNNKHFLVSVLLGLLIFLPNILWQINHNYPLITHMRELNETQLVHVNRGHFLSSQLIAHKGFTIIWLFGLIGVFTIEKLKKYRSIGFAFLLTLLLIGFLQGKSYYTLGAFLILFPLGGVAIEYYLSSSRSKVLILACMFVFTIPFYPFSIPILKVNSLKKYSQYISEHYGINYMLRWEDGNYYNLPQDIADMHGWEELAQKVAKVYHAIPKEQKDKCMIYGGSYSHAGSLNFYSTKYNLPEVYSLNGSYFSWAKEDIEFNNQIMVDDRKHGSSDWFIEMTLVDSIQNPNAREKGYIYYRCNPKINVVEEWKQILTEENDN